MTKKHLVQLADIVRIGKLRAKNPGDQEQLQKYYETELYYFCLNNCPNFNSHKWYEHLEKQ